ncbi:DNA-binding XRE family transcriptional regulator [Tumebacillus sp. BK434]|uniref:helix-turn-helix domain-containing protein n=1 Tax=Tumebacillus sp. BK434 TaxID=2512169 RepID=UPI001053789A|nr:helix-turn-helix domain-containing protein [Tumebacillus sp. BK434]TCP55808.1 DNA-binding XRE family transcriptional regulator [Tumebacillus sp. BK434]
MSASISLGQRIRNHRLRIGITQIDLAQGLCTPSMISQIESDRARPSYKILYGIADRLSVPLEQLLQDVDLNLEHISFYKMALCMVQAGEYHAAIPLLESIPEVKAASIPSAKLKLELAKCYVQTGELDRASSLLLSILDDAKFR